MIGMATQPNITVKAPRDLIEELRTIAKLHNRTMHGELKTALEQYVRRNRPRPEKEHEEEP
jgi:predicted transcriptional regulator